MLHQQNEMRQAGRMCVVDCHSRSVCKLEVNDEKVIGVKIECLM